MKKLLFLLLPLLLLNCAKHDDFPQAVAISAPQVPIQFEVDMVDAGIYQLDWQVADSTQVSYYRIFIYDPYAGPAEVAQTTVSEYYYEFPIAVTEVIWGVSAVSIENVESKTVYAFDPVD